MKNTRILLCSLLLLAGFAPRCARCARPQGTLIDAVAAIVNESVITYQDVEQGVDQVRKLLYDQYGSNPKVYQQKLNQAWQEQLEELVERKLILHEFNTANYSFPKSVIEDEIQRRIREHYGDLLHLNRTLQEEGKTYEQWRKQIRELIIVGAMRSRNVNSEIVVSPYKIQAYYDRHRKDYHLEDQVKLQMIFLPRPPKGSTISLDALAREILEKLQEGASFKQMAAVYGSQSRDSSAGAWFERSALRSELRQTAFSLEPGQLSGVIRIAAGAYILRVIDKRPAHVRPLSEVRDEIEQALKAQEKERLEKQWIDRLKAKSFVRYFP